MSVQTPAGFTKEQLTDLREELKYQLRKLNVRFYESEIDEIMKGIDEGDWIKQLYGPFLGKVNEIIALIEQEASIICNEYLETDSPTKLKNCVAENKQLLILNLILNEKTDGEPFNESIRRTIYDADAKLKPN